MASPAAVLSIIVNANTTQASAALGRTQAQLKGTAAQGQAASAATSRYGQVARTAAMGGVAALGYGLYKTVSIGMDFEKQLSSLGAVTNATEGDLKKLKDQALDMSQKTIFGAREVVQAQTELAKGGLRTKDILGGALPAALNLAAAGELDLATAASTTTNAMNLFSINADDAGHVADALATAANTTTADVQDFAMALTQGGSAAKQAGLTFDDTVVILEALAQAGIKNSDAGTSMKTALLQLVAPTTRQSALARQLGLDFTNQAGAMKKPAVIADMLRDKLGGMTKAQRAATLKVLAGTDGFRTLAALYDLGGDKARKLGRANDEVGTAAKTAAAKTDNLSGDLERLKGNLEANAIEIYDRISPALREFAKGADKLVTSLGGIEESMLNNVDIDLESILKAGADPSTLVQKWGSNAGAKFADTFLGGATKTLNDGASGIFGPILSAANKVKGIQGLDKDVKFNVEGDPVGKTKNIFAKVSQILRGNLPKLKPDVDRTKPQAVIKALFGDVSSSWSKNPPKMVPTVDGAKAKTQAQNVHDEIKNIFGGVITQVINVSRHVSGGKKGRARGGRNIGPEMALWGEQGRELMRTADGGWLLSPAGPSMVGVPRGADIFTASETRKLLAMGIPGFKGGKHGGAAISGSGFQGATEAEIDAWQAAADAAADAAAALAAAEAARQEILADLYKTQATTAAQRSAVSLAQAGVLSGTTALPVSAAPLNASSVSSAVGAQGAESRTVVNITGKNAGFLEKLIDVKVEEQFRRSTKGGNRPLPGGSRV